MSDNESSGALRLMLAASLGAGVVYGCIAASYALYNFANRFRTGPKIVVVFGATGSQGGSVVRAMCKNPEYKVKAVTRYVKTAKARQLQELGVEVIEADYDDVYSLTKALAGAWGVFAVTQFWELLDAEREVEQGQNIADACKQAGIQFMVYSGLENVESQIDKPCPHFDSKARVLKYIRHKKIPVCSVHYSFYMENLLSTMKPRRDELGHYTMDIPMEGYQMDMVSVAHAGECIHQIFNDSYSYAGRIVGLSSDKKTIDEYANILSKHLMGKTVRAGKVTCDQMAKAGFPGSQELANMFEFYISGKYTRDIELTRELNPDIPDFETWVIENKIALQAALDI